jgi:hypothetical protein
MPLALHSRHHWKGNCQCQLGRGGPHACGSGVFSEAHTQSAWIYFRPVQLHFRLCDDNDVFYLFLQKVLCTEQNGWVVWSRANPGKMDKERQTFKQCGRRIFTGKCKQVTTDNVNREEDQGQRVVTRARGWWKRGVVAA